MLGKVVSRLDSWNIVLSMVVCGICFAEPDTILVFKIYFGVFEGGICLAMPKIICAPDSSSLKPSSGATEGVLDYGVLGYPNYMHVPDCWAMKIQDRSLSPVSGWDSPWCGRQAWRLNMKIPFSVTDFVQP